MKKILLFAFPLILGFSLGLYIGNYKSQGREWASAQVGMLIPILEYFRSSGSEDEEERMEIAYHHVLMTMFSTKYSSEFKHLDKVHANKIFPVILDLRKMKGKEIYEEKRLPVEVREIVPERMMLYLDHIGYEIEPVAGTDATR